MLYNCVDVTLTTKLKKCILFQEYPKNRLPGWDRGSIAYHADDGKVFIGCGVGEKFGPKCHKGDTMGCGISFPVPLKQLVTTVLILSHLSNSLNR